MCPSRFTSNLRGYATILAWAQLTLSHSLLYRQRRENSAPTSGGQMKTLILGLFLVACVSVPTRPDEATTLLVVNGGISVLKIYDPYGRIATIYPNQTECVKLRDYHSDVQLRVVELAGDTAYGPSFTPTSERGWVWKFGFSIRTDVLTLQPAPRCGLVRGR